jgi:hypothetical protein
MVKCNHNLKEEQIMACAPKGKKGGKGGTKPKTPKAPKKPMM